jgi:GH43 family beta-xylosidase
VKNKLYKKIIICIVFVTCSSQVNATQLYKNADPSVIEHNGNYISVEQNYGQKIQYRYSNTVDGLKTSIPTTIYDSGFSNEVWAPEVIWNEDDGHYYVYFTEGQGNNHRMYYISSKSGWVKKELKLPDNKWAIDGVPFKYKNQWYFVWSGWEGNINGEQNLYIVKMTDVATVMSGESRYIISQPRELFEEIDMYPTKVNESPQPIVDPNGQLHIVYSANGSWGENYCLADLRLKDGGDPRQVWDWYKSNGCIFGSNSNSLMYGWDATISAKGVGHLSFALKNGNINNYPASGALTPFLYHGVPMWDNPSPFWFGRYTYSGNFVWWGNVTYTRGGESNSGWGFKFFE